VKTTLIMSVIIMLKQPMYQRKQDNKYITWKIKIYISLIDSSDGEKARLKLWDNKNKNNIGTFLSSEYNQFSYQSTQIFNSTQTIENDISLTEKLDNISFEIWHRFKYYSDIIIEGTKNKEDLKFDLKFTSTTKKKRRNY